MHFYLHECSYWKHFWKQLDDLVFIVHDAHSSPLDAPLKMRVLKTPLQDTMIYRRTTIIETCAIFLSGCSPNAGRIWWMLFFKRYFCCWRTRTTTVNCHALSGNTLYWERIFSSSHLTSHVHLYYGKMIIFSIRFEDINAVSEHFDLNSISLSNICTIFPTNKMQAKLLFVIIKFL